MKAIIFLTLIAVYIPKVNTFIPSEKLVFSTNSFSTSTNFTLDKKSYKLSIFQKCDTADVKGPPFDCYTSIKFSGKLPELMVSGRAYAFAAADINQDGSQEVITLCSHHGNWREIEIFSLSKELKTKIWYQPMEMFMWFPGFEGDGSCDAKLYWLAEKKQVKVMTTNGTDEDFRCNAISVSDWYDR